MLVRVSLGFSGRDFHAVIAWNSCPIEEILTVHDQIKKADGSPKHTARKLAPGIDSILPTPRTI